MPETPNLARFLIGTAGVGAASVGEPGQAPLAAPDIIAEAEALAAQLRAVGAAWHEPVVVFIANRPSDIAGFLGVWLAGCVVAPVHVATPEASAQTLIDRLGARFVVRLGQAQPIARAAPPERPLLAGAALVVFTSGSTGLPKGVVLRHEGLIWKLQVLSRLLGFTAQDVVLVPLQLTFIFGVWVSLLGLMCGARLVLAPKVSVAALETQGEAATILAAVPTLLRMLSAEPTLRAPRLRAILSGGEPLSAALADKLATLLPRAGLIDLFGLTETGSCDFCARPQVQPAARGTIGRPTDGVAFRIREAPELALPKGVGELQIRTPSIMAGYLDDPEQTRAAFADGYFRTGDLATLGEDGAVRLVGRAKDIVSRGGNKIAPLEIENVFAQHEGVLAALAFGVPDERLGERIHLMVVARDPDVSEVRLREWAKDRLERFKTPDVFHFVASLPAGRTGKADRAAARKFADRS